MSSLERYRGAIKNTEVSRQVRSIEGAADVQCAIVDGVGAVAQRAMQGTAFLAQIEGQLGQAVPLAVSRLQAIGDLSALAMGMVVTDTVTRLRRL